MNLKEFFVEFFTDRNTSQWRTVELGGTIAPRVITDEAEKQYLSELQTRQIGNSQPLGQVAVNLSK